MRPDNRWEAIDKAALAKATRMVEAVEFFYEHAGWSYDPKTETPEQGRKRGAQALAEAERDAKEHDDWHFVWEIGDECIGCDCKSDDCACSTGAEHETYTCALLQCDAGHDLNECLARRHGHILASLGSICSPAREYKRVIEAELASEALYNERALNRACAE